MGEINPRRLIVLTILLVSAVFIPVLYPIIRQHFREEEQRRKVQENMKQIGEALLKFEAEHPHALQKQIDQLILPRFAELGPATAIAGRSQLLTLLDKSVLRRT